MLRIVVMVSGGGTNLQAIIDGVKNGTITNTEIAGVISNNRNAYALERAEKSGIPNRCVSPKDYESREIFNEKLLEAVDEYSPDLIVLAGFLVVIPPAMIERYRNRMINIHPSLIPSFCGKGYYGLKVHEAALERGVKVVGATRYTGGAPAQSHGAGGVDHPSACDRPDRQRESPCGRPQDCDRGIVWIDKCAMRLWISQAHFA